MAQTIQLIPSTVTPEYLEKVCSVNQVPEVLGLRFSEVGPDFIKGTLTVDHRHLRPGGIMNGGISLVIIETLGSVASFCTLNSEKQNALGIQVTANHLRIANPGDVITGTATPIHIGKTTHIWDVNIENQNKKLISSGRITMLITEK